MELMNEAVRDCLVTSYEDLIASLSLPDPDDRHVLAAAMRAGAEVIVTYNLSDFPTEALARFDIEAQHPDDFLLCLLDLAPGGVSPRSSSNERVCATQPRPPRNSSPRWKATASLNPSPDSVSSSTCFDSHIRRCRVPS